MSRDFPVTGLRELDSYLSALPSKLQKGAYRAGLVAAARVVRDEARLRAPKGSGKLAKGIKTGSPRQNQDGTFSVAVRLTGHHAFIGHIWEYGSQGYTGETYVRQGKRRHRKRKVKTDGAKIFGLFPDIAPHAAHPFMRPALDVKGDEAIQAFAVRIRAYIEGKTGFAAPIGDD